MAELRESMFFKQAESASPDEKQANIDNAKARLDQILPNNLQYALFIRLPDGVTEILGNCDSRFLASVVDVAVSEIELRERRRASN